jgi:starch synthase
VSARVRPTRSVLIIGSEALPFAKTGGLADVLGALPPALARLGWDAAVVLPRYRHVEAAGTPVGSFPLAIGGQRYGVTLYEVPIDGARAILVDIPELFDRDQLYGVGNADYPDNPRRFAFLVRAALEYAGEQAVPPSVIHAHDWQAGLAPVYLKTFYADSPTLARTPCVFTIHNLAYQGNFEPDWLPRLDLPWELLGLEAMEFWGRISFLKGGINYSELITTVSPRYADEIQTPEFGFGFEGILRRRSADLHGVLNGIDVEQWNPARDPYLPQSFTAADLAGKRASKAAVLGEYGLREDDVALRRPLIGMISRMVDQKGFDLIAALPNEIAQLDASFAVLGTGEPRYQDFWRGLSALHPDRIGARIGFDERMAHLIEAGADIFLMPSQFEPCGLNQMYSMRYGTVPVVRRVGGLADTVRDYTTGQPDATGFSFDEYTPAALLAALSHALALYRDPVRWQALQLAGMRQDHSWDRSAREYVKIYERAMNFARQPSVP